MNVAVVGATGMVGREMLQVLEASKLQVSQLIPVASDKNAGNSVIFKGKHYTLVTMKEAIASKPDIVLMSAGGDVSLQFAPAFAEVGSFVIDNSSAWRMKENIKLIVPEINGKTLTAEDKIIANPNCSTIQLVMVLKPLHDLFTIKRVIVSTYQSVTGTGAKAVQQLENERNGIDGERAYAYTIDKNCIPHCDVFLDNLYTKEEMKLTHETKKILGDESVLVSATAVRVPVVGGHSEAVNIEFEKPFTLEEIRSALSKMPNLVVQDNPKELQYPMPITSHGKNETFVGRIREDFTRDNALNLWIVADNLRRGAATNAVWIAEHLQEQFFSNKA